MFKRPQTIALIALAVGALFGYAAASGKWNPFHESRAAAPPGGQTARQPSSPGGGGTPEAECCSDGTNKGQLLAVAARIRKVAAAQEGGKKPNIVVIMGDDIGWYNPSCYHRGDMGYQTPNIDRIAKEGAL